jgi:hypothetical protein
VKKRTLAEVSDFYQALRPRRMVITGPAGSGKTVLAIELILGLLEQRGAEDPVPVRLSAASLDASDLKESAVEQWMQRYLIQVYGLWPVTAQALIEARLALPVVDSLDEMDADDDPGYNSRAAEAVRSFNAYQHGRSRAELVLTCRSEQYQALQQSQEWLKDAAHIAILPVSLAAARGFLIGRVRDAGRWQPVLDAMKHRRSAALAESLATHGVSP